MDCLLLYRSWWPGETFAVNSLHFPSKGDCTWFEIVVGNNGNVRGLMGYEVIAKFLNDNILLVDAMPSDFGHHVHCSLFYFVPQEAASTTHPSCTTIFGLFTKMPLFKILILHQLAVFFLLNLSVNFWAKPPTWLFLWLLEPIWNCSQVVKPRKLVALWQLFPISRNWTWSGGLFVKFEIRKKRNRTWLGLCQDGGIFLARGGLFQFKAEFNV